MKHKYLPLMILLLIAALAAGCGGKKKKTEGGATATGVSVTGRVDLYTGFGMMLDREGKSAALAKGAMVKLYKVTASGALEPLSTEPGAPVSADGAFTLANVQNDSVNIVASVETQDGGRALTALIPAVGESGLDGLIISPETHIEAQVFQEALRRASQPDSGAQGLTAANMDASLIKELVTSDLVFDPDLQSKAAGAVPRLAAVALYAQRAYVEDLFGPGKPALEQSALDITAHLRRYDTALELLDEKSYVDTVSATDLTAASLRQLAHAAEAARDKTLYQPGFSNTGMLQLARLRRLQRAARCLEAKPSGDCPALAQGDPDMSAYADALARRARDGAQARDTAARALYLDSAAADPFADPATGTFDFSVKNAIKNFKELLALQPEALRGVNEILRADAPEVLDADADPQQSAARAKAALKTARDYLLVGVMGVDFADVSKMEAAVVEQGAALARAAYDPGQPLADVSKSRTAFMEKVEAALAPLRDHITEKYAQIPQSERSKLYFAAKVLFLSATATDVPAYLFEGKDTDGDGVADETETALGNDPAKSDDHPSPVSVSSPVSLLPPQPRDADDDGVIGDIERMAGTDPDNAASVPDFRKLVFCPSGADMPCEVSKEQQPEAADTAEASVSGTVDYSGAPKRGVSVAVYSRPAFLKMKPAAVSAPTGADGAFKVAAPAGGYFAVAFIDNNGNGRPDTREAAGYHGAAHPKRVSLGTDQQLETPVELIGPIGGAPCPAGKVQSPDGGACADACPADTSPDALTGVCVCNGGKMFAITTAACVDACPAGTLPDAAGLRCVCPRNAFLDTTDGTCECAAGMTLDASAAACVCAQGYYDPTTNRCGDACSDTRVPDADTRACECPAGTALDEMSNLCVCDGGRLHDIFTHNCAASCPAGLVPDGTGKTCVCPDNETPDHAAGKCECFNGLERAPDSGKCQAPAYKPETPQTATQTAPMPETATGTAPGADRPQPPPDVRGTPPPPREPRHENPPVPPSRNEM